MQAAHTPTPWVNQSDRTIIGGDGYTVATVDQAYAFAANWTGAEIERPEIEAAANAAIIIRAVNAHAELLAACLAALDFITAGGQGAPPLDALRAAIAKVRAAS